MFLKKRLSRIVPPFVFWLVVTTLLAGGTDNFWVNIWTLNYAGHLWYIYMLIGLLFIVPIVNPFLQKASEKEILLYLTIWGITLIFNGNYFESLHIYKLDNYGMSASNIFFAFISFYGYFGYYLLGFIASRRDYKKKSLFIYAVCSIISLFLTSFLFDINIKSAWFYLSIPVVLMSYAVLILFKSFKTHFSSIWEQIIPIVSNLTFGVYLIHGLVIHFIKNIPFFHSVNTLLTGLLVFMVSLGVVYLISFLPFKKTIIG